MKIYKLAWRGSNVKSVRSEPLLVLSVIEEDVVFVKKKVQKICNAIYSNGSPSWIKCPRPIYSAYEKVNNK